MKNGAANIQCDEIAGVYCSAAIPPGAGYGDIRGYYHQLINEMRTVESEMRASGSSDEDIARVLVQMRNAAKVTTRGLSNPEDVAVWEARNVAKYGDPIGPTADYQYARYGSWEKVIERSYVTSAEYDQAAGIGGSPVPVEPDVPGESAGGIDPIDPVG
jgi:hypothetical protein